MRRVVLAIALGLWWAAAAAVPFWGARKSSPVDTAPADLKPGQWFWAGDNKALGPMAVIVSLTEQRAYVYRNGLLIAVSTISSGKRGYRTPTGVFTILQKDRNHRSNKYDNAPMPYQQRLTWDGIALHAGGLPGYPESHGCVHLPTQFAILLFEATNMGMIVVVAAEGASADTIVHPTAVIPIEPLTGEEVDARDLESHEQFRWTPEKSPDGAVSIIISRTDERALVYRNGIEIGRARVLVRRDPPVTGTHAYVAAEGFMDAAVPGLPGVRMPRWITVGIPGRDEEAGRVLDERAVARFVLPREFVAALMPLLTPGVIVLTTDSHIDPDAVPRNVQVLDSDPPERRGKSAH